MGWDTVDPQRFVNDKLAPGQKPILDSTGSYTDIDGRPDISGNTIIRRWKDSGSQSRNSLTLFALIWNGIVMCFLLAIFDGSVRINGRTYLSILEAFYQDKTVLLFVLFPIIGIGFMYSALAIWVNHTSISIDYDTLIVKRGPIPWPPLKVEIRLSELRQLYIQSYSSYKENKRPVISFRIMAQIAQGSDILIEKGMDTYSDARILEQWIEHRAGIQDYSVPGEVYR